MESDELHDYKEGMLKEISGWEDALSKVTEAVSALRLIATSIEDRPRQTTEQEHPLRPLPPLLPSFTRQNVGVHPATRFPRKALPPKERELLPRPRHPLASSRHNPSDLNPRPTLMRPFNIPRTRTHKSPSRWKSQLHASHDLQRLELRAV
jgi:hypothetical protein